MEYSRDQTRPGGPGQTGTHVLYDVEAVVQVDYTVTAEMFVPVEIANKGTDAVHEWIRDMITVPQPDGWEPHDVQVSDVMQAEPEAMSAEDRFSEGLADEAIHAARKKDGK